MEMLRLTDVDPDHGDGDADATEVPREQRTALQAAVEHGYYETPRQIELSDLAEKLEIPRSTLSYRLRNWLLTDLTSPSNSSSWISVCNR